MLGGLWHCLGPAVLLWNLIEPGCPGAQSIPLPAGVDGHILIAIEMDRHVRDPGAGRALEGKEVFLQGPHIFLAPEVRSLREGTIGCRESIIPGPVIEDSSVLETLCPPNIISTFQYITKVEGFCVCSQGQASSKFPSGNGVERTLTLEASAPAHGCLP